MTTETPILKLSPLYAHLRRWGLRLRLVESLSWGPWGGAVGLLLGLLIALAARLWPLLLSRQVLDLAGLSMLAGLAVGLAIAWLRPRRPLHLARTFDRRLGLAERLATAVEIGTGRLQAVPVMARVQLADTLDIARHTDHRALLPLRVSRPALIALLVLMAGLVTLLWLPNPQEDVLLQRAAVRAAIEEQIEDLEAIKEEVAQAEGLTEEERKALLKALEEAIAGLEEGGATPEEAVAALSEAEQALAKLQDPGAAKVQAGLERAAEGMEDSALTEEIAEALARGDYQAAAEALAKYGTEEGQNLTDEEALELARELAEAAEALAEADPELAEKLAEAAEAIESGDISEAAEAIQEAAAKMGEAGERVERQEAVEGVLAELQEGREGIAQAGGMPGQGGAQGQQAGSGQQTQPGHSEDAGSGAPYDEDYDPDRIGEEGVGVDVGREGGEGVTIGDVSVPAPDGGSTSVPYRDVYADYSEQAGAALEGSYIPLGMKQYVRDYFSSLEP
jgi:predicted DNA-binding protein